VALDELRTLINQQADLMVAVATGGPRIEDKQDEYRERRRQIAGEIRRLGLEDPNPHSDLWAWYGHWTREFPAGGGGYGARRAYVRELYGGLLDAIDSLEDRTVGSGLHEPTTGWERVDHQLAQLRERYATAETTEDAQGVGHLCREIFVSLADACFDRTKHLPEGEAAPESVSERLNAVADFAASGGSNRELRKLLKAALDFANKVQHDRDATLEKAAVVAEATVTSASLLSILVRGAQLVAAAADDQPDELDLEGLL